MVTATSASPRSGALAYSESIDRALVFAARAHHGQFRKGTNIPYILHPMHVALILDRYGYPEDILVAGILHDVLEDVNLPESTLGQEFGEKVLDIVRWVSERKYDAQGHKLPWRVRKEELLGRLEQAPDAAIIVKAADHLHNACAILLDTSGLGTRVWEHFNGQPHEIVWFYTRVTEIAERKLGDAALVHELRRAVDQLTATARMIHGGTTA